MTVSDLLEQAKADGKLTADGEATLNAMKSGQFIEYWEVEEDLEQMVSKNKTFLCMHNH